MCEVQPIMFSSCGGGGGGGDKSIGYKHSVCKLVGVVYNDLPVVEVAGVVAK
jgi:hypothetical protein